jgi:TatD DNase family protein
LAKLGSIITGHRLAEQKNLPLIFHVRDKFGLEAAELDMADWIVANRPKRFVLHAFGGHPRLLEVGLEAGGYFSFAGPLTYKKNDALRQCALDIPRDRVFVETDAPFLPPEPFRGKRNHPALCRFTLAKLAEIWGINALEAEAITDQNAKDFFNF